MYIRRTQTRNTTTGERYFTHRLVCSRRVGDKVRQVTLLNLGRHFALAQEDWPTLCARLEEILSGQGALLGGCGSLLIERALQFGDQVVGVLDSDGNAINVAEHGWAVFEKVPVDTDDDPEEQERGITIFSACVKFSWQDFNINLLDTPGHEDFSEDTYRTLTAVDSALMVIDCAKGVEQRTIKLMEVCRLRDTPIMTFINKLDRDGREPIELLDEIEASAAQLPPDATFVEIEGGNHAQFGYYGTTPTDGQADTPPPKQTELPAAALRHLGDRARVVAEFLGEIFQAANPGAAHGGTIDARELLGRGAER